MYDAVFVVVEAFNKLLKKKPEVGESLRRGPLFNNGSRLDCYANYSNNTWVTPWEHGDKISKHLRKVRIISHQMLLPPCLYNIMNDGAMIKE